MTITTPQRRTELAAFLRSRRGRITPADVGMPGGLRRRTPGLRREEVAQPAGVGVPWYTWLEQGRPINVSVQVLEAIARTLRLDQTEYEHLFRLAGVPSVTVPPAHDRLQPPGPRGPPPPAGTPGPGRPRRQPWPSRRGDEQPLRRPRVERRVRRDVAAGRA